MYFAPGVKTSKKDFFNFEPELDALIRELKSEETRMVVIKGVRRTGKSSLLRVGLAELKAPSLFMDAREFGPFSPDLLYELMADSLSRLVARHRVLRELLGRIEGVSVAGVRIDIVRRKRPVLVRVLEELGKWGESRGEPVVLALDEAQEFRLFPKFDALLAHVYDYCRGIKLVLAGSEVGVLDEFLGKKKPKAPLFGRPYFEIEMRRLPEEKAEEFLREGFRQLGRRPNPSEISEAISTFDGIIGWLTSYGYHASRIGHRRAVDRTIEEGTKLVREELEAFLAPRRQARARYLWILQMLASPKSWSEVKRGLAAKLGRVVSDKQLSHYLSELVGYGFAIQADRRYRLADPLVARAVSGMR
jgi:hypothetical protein